MGLSLVLNVLTARDPLAELRHSIFETLLQQDGGSTRLRCPLAYCCADVLLVGMEVLLDDRTPDIMSIFEPASSVS